jgi:hypothetical protein
MKLQILIGFLIMTNLNIVNSQTVVYQQTLSIDKKALEEESPIDTTEYDYTEEELLEQKQFDEDMDKWIDTMTEKESKEKFYYTIGEDQIRYRRKLRKPGVIFSEEWILIDKQNRIMNHYYIHNTKGPQKTEFPLDRTTFRDLEVTYEKSEDKSDVKTILGYECHKVILTETITDLEYGTEIQEYEMYVTDQIKLPFHLLNTTLKPIEELCPLQMTIYRKDKGETYTKMNAIKILTGSEADELKLPNRFRVE